MGLSLTSVTRRDAGTAGVAVVVLCQLRVLLVPVLVPIPVLPIPLPAVTAGAVKRKRRGGVGPRPRQQPDARPTAGELGSGRRRVTEVLVRVLDVAQSVLMLEARPA